MTDKTQKPKFITQVIPGEHVEDLAAILESVEEIGYKIITVLSRMTSNRTDGLMGVTTDFVIVGRRII